jgi:hypothetical protein
LRRAAFAYVDVVRKREDRCGLRAEAQPADGAACTPTAALRGSTALKRNLAHAHRCDVSYTEQRRWHWHWVTRKGSSAEVGGESTGDALLERRSDQRERAEPEALDVARRRIQREGAAAAVPISARLG